MPCAVTVGMHERDFHMPCDMEGSSRDRPGRYHTKETGSLYSSINDAVVKAAVLDCVSGRCPRSGLVATWPPRASTCSRLSSRARPKTKRLSLPGAFLGKDGVKLVRD